MHQRIETLTGLLFGTFRVTRGWSRWLPLYVGRVFVGGRLRGVAVAVFGRSAYVCKS